MNTSTRTAVAGSMLAGALLASLGFAGAASASGGGGGGGAVSNSVRCTTGTISVKAKAEDGGLIQVESELDTNRVGQTWSWTIKDDGRLVRSGTSRTAAPSGSFSVTRLIADRAGSDTIRFGATNTATGAACAVSVTL